MTGGAGAKVTWEAAGEGERGAACRLVLPE
jgi:hypothetical protein